MPICFGRISFPLSAGSTHSEPPDWPRVYGELAVYLDLILKWNERINLTSIRAPEEIVRRHFGESLFAGAHLGACDPARLRLRRGLPRRAHPTAPADVQVTLAESRVRKAAFLHEVCAPWACH